MRTGTNQHQGRAWICLCCCCWILAVKLSGFRRSKSAPLLFHSHAPRFDLCLIPPLYLKLLFMQNHQTKTVNLTELCDKKLSRIPVAFAQKAPFTYRQDPQYAHFLSPLEHIRYVPGMEHLSYDHPRNPRWGVQPSDAKLNVPQVLRRGHKAAEPSYEPPVSNRPVRPPIRGTFRGKSKEEYMRIV